MKKKTKREINCIKVNLNTINKYENHKKLNNISYVKIKENYDSYKKRNQSKKLLKDNSTINRKSRDNIEITKNSIKEENINLTLVPLIPKNKRKNKENEDIKKTQRNMISLRRMKYSMKVKNAANNKKLKNCKYDINKVVIIQKWVKGFLLRSFLCNASEVEKIINEFVGHIYKFLYLKFNIFKNLKTYDINNIKDINDNFTENKKYFLFANDNISISNINTNNNTNSFTIHNTFSVGQETSEIFDNTNKGLLIYQKRIYKTPSIRELLMINSDVNKPKSINQTINKKYKNEINIKVYQKAKAKSSSNIKKSDTLIKSDNKSNYKSIPIFSVTNIKLKGKEEINHKIGKVTNLRTLLFNNINNNNNTNEIIYKKPLIKSLYISKDSYYNKINIVNTSPKSEKLFLPIIYQLSLDDNTENNSNLKDRKDNPNFYFEKIMIDEIKEVKEDEEDDSQSPFIKKINTSFYNDISKQNIPKSQISEIINNNTNLNNNYNIVSSSFQINPRIDKKKILIVLLLEKQIKFCLKPYIFNLIKNYWKNKIFC